MQTTGYSDYQVIRNYFGARRAKVSYRVPKANPPVRDRVALMNARLCNARGEVQLFVDPKCRELIADFEQVSYQEDSTQIDKDKDRRRTHLSDALGYLIWQEDRKRYDRGTRGEAILTTMTFTYRTGTSRLHGEGADVAPLPRSLCRRRAVPAATRPSICCGGRKKPLEVYQERLARVFYENYLGSIVDWYTATLVRREPVLEFAGTNERGKGFLRAVRAELRSARNDADAVLQAADHGGAGVREVLCGGGFSARLTAPALTRADEDASGRSRAYLVGYSADEVINWSYDQTGRTGVGRDPDFVAETGQRQDVRMEARDALDLLRPREIRDLRAAGRGRRRRSSWWIRGGTDSRESAACRFSSCG